MSKEFGLDWRKYEAKRMSKFLFLMRFEGEESKNKTKNNQPKFRPSYGKRKS
jgi:hypothetical protein